MSEEIGVSPWHFWADVTPEEKESIQVSTSNVIKNEPDVKYRAIFINDEVNLMRWSRSVDPEYSLGPESYKLIYELLLRLNMNFMKPASHPYSDQFIYEPEFPEGADPLQNAKNADEYGVVVGSAAPMFRENLAQWPPFADEWQAKNGYKPGFDYSVEANRPAIEAYWEKQVVELGPYEAAWSLGMRGLSDSGMTAVNAPTNAAKAELLTEIIRKQQELLAEHINGDTNFEDGLDLDGILMTFEVYKEVLNIYNAGLKDTLPQEVAIIWSEDNHGNIRQFPNEEEQARSGGNTLYYHLSYWGSPQSYLWLYTTPLSKVGSELDSAYQNGIQTAWIFNVGDIKPAELALDYVANKSWDIDYWEANKTKDFMTEWSGDIFGVENSEEIADIIETSYELGISRRPEFSMTNNFDQINFGDEWTIRMSQYEDLFLRANSLYESTYKGTSLDDAFYQLVVYPVRGAYYSNSKFYYYELYELYNDQGRGIATSYAAAMAKESEEKEFAETKYYNEVMSDGKWNGIMDPYPPGEPELNVPDAYRLTDIPFVNVSTTSELGVVAEGSRLTTDNHNLDFSSITQDSRFVDVFSTGTEPITWTATTESEWITLSKTYGSTVNERIWISVDFDKAPKEITSGTITFKSDNSDDIFTVNVNADNTKTREDYTGYVEANGYISIEAENFDKAVSRSGYNWITYDNLGRYSDAMMTYPVVGDRITTNITSMSPELQYELNFNEAGTYDITFYRMPTLDSTGVRLAYSLNDDEPVIIDGNKSTSGSWSKNVLEGIEKITKTITVPSAGKHTLKVFMVDPGVSFDQIVIETTKGVDSSYFAVPQSYHSTKNITPGQLPVGLSLGIDETALLINGATALLIIDNLGDGVGQYSKEKYDVLKTALDTINTVIADENSTQTEKEEAKLNLTRAMAEFSSSRVMTDGVYTYFFYEDFDNRLEDNDVSGIDSHNASALNIVEKDGKIYLSSKTHIDWFFEPQENFLIAEYDFSVANNVWTSFQTMYDGPFVKDQHDLPGPSIITTGSGSNAKLQVRNPAINNWQNVENGVLTHNQWYAAKIEVDIANQTYDYYLDGVLLVDDMGFRSTSAKKISQIAFGGGSGGLDYSLDNVRIYATNEVPSSIVLDAESINLKVNETAQIIATVTPDVNPIWTSSNDTIVTVDENGNITALAEGTVTITATIPNIEISASCIVTVIEEDTVIIPPETNDLLAKAESLLTQINVGDGLGQYSADKKAELQTAKEALSTAIANPEITQEELTNAISSLTTAIAGFENSRNMNADDRQYLVYEDFDYRLATGQVNDIVSEDNSKLSITNENDKIFLSAQSHTDFHFTAQDKYVGVNYDFKVNNKTWTTMPTLYEGPFVENQFDMPGPCIITTGEGDNVVFRMHDGTSWKNIPNSNISAGEWYNIKLEIDVENKTYDFYLNDVLLLDNAKFRKTEAKNISQISFGGGNTEIDYAIDNLSVFTNIVAVANSVSIIYGTATTETATAGTDVTVTANAPQEGQKFTGWTAEGVTLTAEQAAANSFTFAMPENAVVLTANYADITKFMVTATANDGGSVTGGGLVAEGSQVTLTATPNDDYSFVNWTVDGTEVSTEASYTFTPDNNITVTANFKADVYTITLTNAKLGNDEYKPGDEINAVPVIPEGEVFLHWEATGLDWEINRNDYQVSFTMPRNDVTLKAVTRAFEYYDVTTTVNNVEAGTVSESTNVREGVSTTVTATPNTGYRFVDWTVDGEKVSADAEYTFTPTANVTITANFENIKYSITVVNGTAKNGKDSANYLKKMTVTATVPEGYKFVEWQSADGVEFNDPKSETTTFLMPANNVTVTAVLAKELTFTFMATDGIITGDSVYTEDMSEGGNIATFPSVTANIGYTFKGWSVDGVAVDEDAVYTENTVFTAIFSEKSEGSYSKTNDFRVPKLSFMTPNFNIVLEMGEEITVGHSSTGFLRNTTLRKLSGDNNLSVSGMMYKHSWFNAGYTWNIEATDFGTSTYASRMTSGTSLNYEKYSITVVDTHTLTFGDMSINVVQTEAGGVEFTIPEFVVEGKFTSNGKTYKVGDVVNVTSDMVFALS